MIFQQFKPQIIGLLFFALCGNGCISVNIAPKSLQRAEKVSYKSPPAPFKELSSGSADKAWRNSENGNSITYVSECGDHGRIALKEVARTLLSSQGLTLQSQKTITHKGVEAVLSQGHQQNQSALVQVELLTFLKNDCLFNLAYLGKKSEFPKDQPAFQSFKEDFDPL